MPEKSYESPRVTDYGDLQTITANNRNPVFVDVPQGTEIIDGDIGAVVGDNEPGMS